MRFTLFNSIPPGPCRKLHILAPGGHINDLVLVTRDRLHEAGLSPTHMEAVQGLAEWQSRGISPPVGLLLWYFESKQKPVGALTRTSDSTFPSVGVAIRFLQIVGTLGIKIIDVDAVGLAASWLDNEIGEDGLLRMPASGLADYGMLARSIRSLRLVGKDSQMSNVESAYESLRHGQLERAMWPTYPGGRPSIGATSLALSALATAPERFAEQLDPEWLLAGCASDGAGWGEYSGSPARVDNTFWASRALSDLGEAIPDTVIDWARCFKPSSHYEHAMHIRLALLLGVATNSGRIEELAMASLTERADRYSETALYGLTLVESAVSDTPDANLIDSLPVRSPEFIRREPPIYDQLAGAVSNTRWLKAINRLAEIGVVESVIGWFIGIAAALTIVGEELIEGLGSLPLWVLVPLLAVEGLVVIIWLSARLASMSRLRSLPHFMVAFGISIALVRLVTNPEEINLSLVPALVLALILAVIIDVVTVAADKAGFLNRLDSE